MSLRTVGIQLVAQVSGYVQGLRQAGTATASFARQLDQAARAGKLDAVADQAARLGVALVGVAGWATMMSAKFEQAMSSVQAATHASAEELEQLRQAAMAIEELAKAGVSTADILGGGLSGALDLAAAGQMEVADAAEVAASTLTQFSLAGRDVGHVADLLAAGAGKAQGSVHHLSMGLSQGGLVAAQMGLSVEDTVGTLAAFASAGLLGSDAGTSLKTALLMLANPTGQAADLMAELGIQTYDASGNFVGVVDLAGQLRTQLGGLTQQQRNAALATIFGSDAIRAASILYERGADGIQQWIDAVDDQGFAAETARLKTDNLIGDIERLTGELETLAITSGGGVNSGLRVLSQTLEAFIGQIGSLPGWLSSGAVVVSALTGVVLLGAAAWIKSRRATALMIAELNAVGPAGARAATGLQAVMKWGGRAAAAFLGLQVAAMALDAAAGKQLNPQLDAMALGLERWANQGQVTGEAARLLGADFELLSYDLKALDTGFWSDIDRGMAGVIEGLTGTGHVFEKSLTNARERLAALDSALTHMVQSGNSEAAAVAFARIAEEAEKQGISITELKKGLPGYAATLEMAEAAADGTAGSIKSVADEAAAAAEQVEELKEAFDRLFDVEMDLDKATIAYKKGIAEVRKELAEGTRTLNINSKAGQDNALAVLDQIGKIKELRKTRIEHGMTLEKADKLYGKELASLRATMLQLGFNEKAVDELIGKYQDIPERVTTEFGTPGLPDSKKNVDDFNFALKNVPPSKRVPFYADTEEAKSAIKALKAKIDELKSKKIYIEGSVRWTSSGDLKVPGGTLVKNRDGGVYEHAAVGVLREAQIASPMGPARYAWAEPETGGELFAPRFGDMNKIRREVGYAVENWWGGWHNFLPAMPQSAAPQSHGVVVENLHLSAYSDRFSMSQVRDELAMYGVS